MSSHPKIKHASIRELDLPSRLALVKAAYITQGHINRQILVATYGISQIQAGALMREFIAANSKTITWFPENTHYKLVEK